MRLKPRIAPNYPRVHRQGAGLGKRRLALHLTSKRFLCTEGALGQLCELPSDCKNKYPEILNYSQWAGVSESWAQGVSETSYYKSQMAPIPLLFFGRAGFSFSRGWYIFWGVWKFRDLGVRPVGVMMSAKSPSPPPQSALEENSRYFSYCCCSSNSPELRTHLSDYFMRRLVEK